MGGTRREGPGRSMPGVFPYSPSHVLRQGLSMNLKCARRLGSWPVSPPNLPARVAMAGSYVLDVRTQGLLLSWQRSHPSIRLSPRLRF